MGWDARAGTQPRGTRVTYNLVHEGESVCAWNGGQETLAALVLPVTSSQFSVLMYAVVFFPSGSVV